MVSEDECGSAYTAVSAMAFETAFGWGESETGESDIDECKKGERSAGEPETGESDIDECKKGERSVGEPETDESDIDECEKGGSDVDECEENDGPIEECEKGGSDVDECEENDGPIEECEKGGSDVDECEENDGPIDECEKGGSDVDECKENESDVARAMVALEGPFDAGVAGFEDNLAEEKWQCEWATVLLMRGEDPGMWTQKSEAEVADEGFLSCFAGLIRAVCP